MTWVLAGKESQSIYNDSLTPCLFLCIEKYMLRVLGLSSGALHSHTCLFTERRGKHVTSFSRTVSLRDGDTIQVPQSSMLKLVTLDLDIGCYIKVVIRYQQQKLSKGRAGNSSGSQTPSSWDRIRNKERKRFRDPFVLRVCVYTAKSICSS